VGDRRRSRFNASEKLFRLSSQRFGGLQFFGGPFVFSNNRLAVYDVDSLIVDQKLFIAADVVKHRHPVLSADDQPLLLVRMKPAHKHVTSYAGRKLEIGDRHIRNLCLKVCATGSRYYTGHRTHKPENDREVVRRKAPEDVFLAPHLAEVQTI